MDSVKKHKNSISSFIGILTIGTFGCYIITLQTENGSCRGHLLTAEGENRQLEDEKAQLESSLMDQLQSINNTNQQLQDKNDQINAELQVVKDNNQKLLEEKEGFQTKIDQLDAELQLVNNNNKKLLEEREKFQSQINQMNSDLQSTKDDNQKMLKEKFELSEKLRQADNDRDVYSTQVSHIQKCMEPIEKLEQHIYTVTKCSESKKKGLKSEMCSKISYDFEEGDSNVIIIIAIDLIIKFKKECKPFWDALLLKKVDKMKAQQASTSLEELERKMQQINEECSGYSYQKYKKEKARSETMRQETGRDKHKEEKASQKVGKQKEEKASQETGVGKQGLFGKIVTAAYNFGAWVGSVIFGAFWS